MSPADPTTLQVSCVQMAGRDEKEYCRSGDKLSLFEIDGI